MRKLLLLAALPLISPSLLAQTGPTLKTNSNVGIFVADQNETLVRAKKAGFNIEQPLNLQVNTRTGVTASSQISLRDTNGFLVVTVAARGAVDSQNPKARASFGSTTSLIAQGLHQGPTSVLLNIPLPKGSQGLLRVRYSGTLVGGARAMARVDIGNDRSFEFSQAAGKQVQKDFPVKAGARGIQVLMETNESGQVQGKGKASYETGLVVIFIPRPGCNFISYGKSCGAVLSGETKPTPGGPIVFLNLSKAPKSSPLGLILGIQKRSLKIPGSSCMVLTKPVIFLPFFTNQQGSAKMVLGGGPVKPFTFLAQALVLDRGTFQFSTSNGLEAICR